MVKKTQKNYLYSIVLPLLFCQRSGKNIFVGLFLYSLFHWSVYYFINTTLSQLWFIYNKSWNQIVVSPLLWSSQYCVSSSGSFASIWTSESIGIHKIICYDFDLDCVESHKLGRTDYHNSIASFLSMFLVYLSIYSVP